MRERLEAADAIIERAMERHRARCTPRVMVEQGFASEYVAYILHGPDVFGHGDTEGQAVADLLRKLQAGGER